MGEFIIVNWSAVQGRLKEHDEAVKKIMRHWKKNAKRFKLRSLRYFSQAIGGDPFTYGHVMIYEFESLVDWEFFEKEMEKDKAALMLKEQLFTNIDLRTRRVFEWQDKLRGDWLE